MFDVFGPTVPRRSEALWTDLSEIPDEHYSEENPQHTTQEVIVPRRRSHTARQSCRRRRSKVKRLPPWGELSPQATDEGRACGGSPYTGRRRKLAPHPASGGDLASVRGSGLDSGPTKPVQPRVLRTMYQVLSFMTILIKT